MSGCELVVKIQAGRLYKVQLMIFLMGWLWEKPGMPAI